MAEQTSSERKEQASHHGVGVNRLARVYAEALVGIAIKRDQVDEIGDELRALVHEVLAANPRIAAYLASKAVKRSAKEPVIQKAFEGKFSDTMLDFLRILNRNDRLELLPHVAAAYLELQDSRGKRVRVTVRSAVELDEAQKDKLRDVLRAALQLEPILNTRVDPDLLGGLVVQVGDEVLDSSVRTRIDNFRNQLLARSSYEIQVGRDRFSSTS